jgi:hypothetical protein
VSDRTSDRAPFGPPDGARADLDWIERNFVDFADQPMLDDLAAPAGDRTPRLIVGKKGVGKTVYLRRFQKRAQDDGSLYADRIHHDVPPTEDVIKVCELYDVELAAEAWGWIWRRAIMRSLASHVLCQSLLRDRADPESLDLLAGAYGERLGSFARPRSIYSEVRAIASEARSSDQLARDLRHRDWDDIEDLLGEILMRLPPVCFHLDSVDEQFGSAPFYWLQCQKGLCQQVLELLRDHRFGNRLHVVVSVRELVRSALLQGEHSTRYIRTPHIRILEWDRESITHLLREKIRRLPSEFRMTTSDGVKGWLGRDRIYNRARGVDESVEDYLLRHTRQIPRDVVQLGNELCADVARARSEGRTEVGDEAIRRAVALASKEFADEQIAVCGNHLASDTIPRDAGRNEYSDFYTSAEYSRGVQDEVRAVIGAVRVDRFPLDELRGALAGLGNGILGSHPSPLDVLWLNGLLGYEPADDAGARSHFYGAYDVADFHLPVGYPSYVFHPIVGHSVMIKAAGDRPVRPFG